MLCPESEFVVNKEVSLMELMALVLNVVAWTNKTCENRQKTVKSVATESGF